ncbi:hypothetical protein M409DRAFT_18646 [Zasmidium cellare ATCC 36951]|uniref:NmrA-like domain-containing protein n=1 Tax=Zasmidium cellare ATCC 36951 TaxID=1080233 RepID=A0A6A6CWM8_ZASCE|nr:uncharacterized protein M409DRAFT_18646 [Zasmidium cellare ATCC 36951]KAF2171534.1 hypothetical protein M409DRAFT_18646 [Zasmidium cellare ATCC 36951]
MPSKVFVVFGATGQQGGAVVKLLTSDPVLSQEYSVRAVVRDPSKPAAVALKNLPGCEIVQADLDDKVSLYRAFEGAHSAFLVTNSIFDEHLYEREYAQGQAAADVAVEAGLKYLIFSTLPSVRKLSSNRYTKVWQFDVKYEIEQYIRGLPISSAFIAMGCFMQNLTNALKPRPVGDGTLEIATSMPPDTKLLMIDATDISVFVAAILREPDACQGKIIHAAAELRSLDELAQTVSLATGKTTRYRQLPATAFRTFMEDMNPTFAEDSMEMLGYYQEFGCFGPNMEELVQPSIDREYGALRSVQEYVKELDF